MADHKTEIEEFGNNDDFWIFGYGYSSPNLHLIASQWHANNWQEFDMETSATLW
jgi:hypothetical protein